MEFFHRQSMYLHIRVREVVGRAGHRLTEHVVVLQPEKDCGTSMDMDDVPAVARAHAATVVAFPDSDSLQHKLPTFTVEDEDVPDFELANRKCPVFFVFRHSPDDGIKFQVHMGILPVAAPLKEP